MQRVAVQKRAVQRFRQHPAHSRLSRAGHPHYDDDHRWSCFLTPAPCPARRPAPGGARGLSALLIRPTCCELLRGSRISIRNMWRDPVRIRAERRLVHAAGVVDDRYAGRDHPSAVVIYTYPPRPESRRASPLIARSRGGAFVVGQRLRPGCWRRRRAATRRDRPSHRSDRLLLARLVHPAMHRVDDFLPLWLRSPS